VRVNFIEGAMNSLGFGKTEAHPVAIYVLTASGKTSVLPDMGPMGSKTPFLKAAKVQRETIGIGKGDDVDFYGFKPFYIESQRKTLRKNFRKKHTGMHWSRLCTMYASDDEELQRAGTQGIMVYWPAFLASANEIY